MDGYSTHWNSSIKRHGITAYDFTRQSDPNLKAAHGPNNQSYGRYSLYGGDYNARWAEQPTLGARLVTNVRCGLGEHQTNNAAWKSGFPFNHQFVKKKDVMPNVPYPDKAVRYLPTF